MKIYISNLGIFSTKYEIDKSFCTTLEDFRRQIKIWFEKKSCNV